MFRAWPPLPLCGVQGSNSDQQLWTAGGLLWLSALPNTTRMLWPFQKGRGISQPLHREPGETKVWIHFHLPGSEAESILPVHSGEPPRLGDRGKGAEEPKRGEAEMSANTGQIAGTSTPPPQKPSMRPRGSPFHRLRPSLSSKPSLPQSSPQSLVLGFGTRPVRTHPTVLGMEPSWPPPLCVYSEETWLLGARRA